MDDLFGDSITQPQTKAKSECLNAAFGFKEFWDEWPSGNRKVAKQQCLNKWASLACADQAEKIRKHVAWMKTQEDWLKQNGHFIPAPLVYLNQQRWSEWEVVETLQRSTVDPALAKILADEKKAAPIPESVRALRNAYRKNGRLTGDDAR